MREWVGYLMRLAHLMVEMDGEVVKSTRLQGVDMTKEIDFMRWWRGACDERVVWLLDKIFDHSIVEMSREVVVEYLELGLYT